ncbi:MAG: hypothetical protein M0C28_38965 [Candidatus Moduliflexus flocculans]|nr:hypothetical protein [Candidatus Moduliflexus flocculans]
MPMIALVPVLANAGAVSVGRHRPAVRPERAGHRGRPSLLARFLMPRILHLVVRTRIREVFLIAIAVHRPGHGPG